MNIIHFAFGILVIIFVISSIQGCQPKQEKCIELSITELANGTCTQRLESWECCETTRGTYEAVRGCVSRYDKFVGGCIE